MIESFKHKGLRNLFEEDDGRRIDAVLADRLRLILSAPQRRVGRDGKGQLAGG